MKPRLRLPFKGAVEVTQYFGEVPENAEIMRAYQSWGLLGHNGVDYGLMEGSVVLAVAGGVISKIERQDGFGLFVEISHKWGVSLYAHLSEVKVQVGQKVRLSQKIALSGQTGLVTGPHLHLGIRLNDTSVDNGYLGFSDPMQFIKT